MHLAECYLTAGDKPEQRWVSQGRCLKSDKQGLMRENLKFKRLKVDGEEINGII